MEALTPRRHDGHMTTTPIGTTTPPPTSTQDHSAIDEARLRLVLGANATSSGLGGLAALLAGGPVLDEAMYRYSEQDIMRIASDFFGEAALITGDPRNAHVDALTGAK